MKLTKEEEIWLREFNFAHRNFLIKEGRDTADIMAVGIRVPFCALQSVEEGLTLQVTHGEGYDTSDYNSNRRNNAKLEKLDTYPRSNAVDRYLKRGKNDITKYEGKSYSPRDYISLPELWFSGNWTDRVNDLIDQERGRTEYHGHLESHVPGITSKGALWRVHRFFDNVDYFLGSFVLHYEAESTLIDFNLDVTKTGYGVEYYSTDFGSVFATI